MAKTTNHGRNRVGNSIARRRGYQTCAKIQKKSGILDSQKPGSEILEDIGSYIFIFSWDLKDLGSCHGNIAMGC